ncbi:hypothetical protein [Spirosoma rhododendri]|uniref:Uncharacterized protein n=1 Tax=Spirosoma rhododendri TaxID=2728024 RepID=A0A7L5DVI3_9BACT|nr:hypothetical protein [Spirosoma rhododendri]QJD79560.1 hypothetical protein HH216_14915 [Spirosoma rhododendri]
MKNQLVIPISDDPITGLPRQASLEAFIIQSDLNMTIRARISYLTPDGGPKLAAIAEDVSLSPYQKQVAAEQFVDRITNRQTGGSFVLPATGQIVDESTAMAVAQRDYFQAIDLGDLKALGLTINDQTTLAELMYAVLGMEIRKSDARKEI